MNVGRILHHSGHGSDLALQSDRPSRGRSLLHALCAAVTLDQVMGRSIH